MDAVIEKTVEVPEPEVKTEAKAPTREDLQGSGWSAKEIESAEKRGMIQKAEEKKPEPKPEVKEPVNAEAPVETKEPPKEEPKKDYSHSQQFRDMELAPEQEKELRRLFPFVNGKMNPVEAIYWRGKNERSARQRFQAQLDSERKAREAAEARLAALEGKEPKQEVDELGNVIDPDDQPMTPKKYRELKKAEEEAFQKQQAELNERAALVHEANKTQEEYARTVYPDFDDTVKKGIEVMQNLDTLIPEKWKQAKIVKLYRDFQRAAANADAIGVDEYNAAFMGYEIGQFHPDYGKSNNGKAPTETGTPKDPKANGGLTPGQMKRIEENTQRRPSSASIPGGGGKRLVAPEDVGLADYNKMDAKQRQKFRDDHPEAYAKLRG